MPNPDKEESQLADRNGRPLLGTQQALVADAPAISTYTAPPAGGTTTVTSNAATDLDTANAALAQLVTEVTQLRAQVVALADVLEAHGLMADA